MARVEAYVKQSFNRDDFRAAPHSVNAMRELVASGKMDLKIGQMQALNGADGELSAVAIKTNSGAVEEMERIRSKYGMRYHEQLYAMREDRQHVGMFTDISNVTFGENQLDLIKMQTLDQAQELLDHQIKFSQEMAHFLGRSTAKSEELVKKMVDLYEQKNEAGS